MHIEGYAYRGTTKHKTLMKGNCTTMVEVDFSLNEHLNNIENIDIGLGNELSAYSIEDLIAEKIRSLLQQVKRNRHRRQDIYDLRYLIELFDNFTLEEKKVILNSLKDKSESREIIADKNSLNDHEIKERAKKDYHTLEDEIEGELPDFEESYDKVLSFYQNLPWSS